jgi:hypothetical protein
MVQFRSRGKARGGAALMDIRWPVRTLGALLVCVLAIAGHTQTSANDYQHVGVASCASTVCHGKAAPQTNRDVALNEYRIWIEQDPHSQAYRALASAQSKQIAVKIGLQNPAAAKLCLDCHADNVPAERQGAKFHLSDGVGCEACHGGAEKWIETHAQTGVTHRANLDLGMYPSEQPLRRAELCLSCHLGTRDKFATHMIMAAGHPRLSFELEAFTANQPAHFVVDADYIKRKGKIEGANLWFAGQLENAERLLTLLQSPLFTPGGMIPEFAFYDCYACHHPMEKMRWSAARAGVGVKPGSLRLQTYSLVMLQAVVEALGTPDALAQLASGTDDLVRAGQMDPPATRAAAQRLLDQLHGLEAWARRAYTPADVAKVRKTLLHYAAQDKASDFPVAEQVIMGVESLSYSLADHDRHKAPLDALFTTVKSGSDFNATQFADAAKRVQDQF